MIGGRASATVDAFDAIQSMSVDDGATGFGTTDTALDDAGGAPTNVVTQDFDATPSRTAQTVEHTATFGTGVANFEIKRIALHNALQGSVSATSDTLVGGIDGQSITKTADFSVSITVQITYTDNS